jgi:hypothetical protein
MEEVMQKKINDIEKTWYEITVALTVCDFLGAMQRIRKMGYQLKLLRLDVGVLAELPYPELASLCKGDTDGKK